MGVHFLEDLFAEGVLLQKMPELADSSLVGNRFFSEVYICESSHREVVIKSFLRSRIAEVETVLQEVDSEHLFQFPGWPAPFSCGIEGGDKGAEFCPGYCFIHGFQKFFSSGGFSVFLKDFSLGKASLTIHDGFLPVVGRLMLHSIMIQDFSLFEIEERLNQRFLKI